MPQRCSGRGEDAEGDRPATGRARPRADRRGVEGPAGRGGRQAGDGLAAHPALAPAHAGPGEQLHRARRRTAPRSATASSMAAGRAPPRTGRRACRRASHPVQPSRTGCAPCIAPAKAASRARRRGDGGVHGRWFTSRGDGRGPGAGDRALDQGQVCAADAGGLPRGVDAGHGGPPGRRPPRRGCRRARDRVRAAEPAGRARAAATKP